MSTVLALAFLVALIAMGTNSQVVGIQTARIVVFLARVATRLGFVCLKAADRLIHEADELQKRVDR